MDTYTVIEPVCVEVKCVRLGSEQPRCFPTPPLMRQRWRKPAPPHRCCRKTSSGAEGESQAKASMPHPQTYCLGHKREAPQPPASPLLLFLTSFWTLTWLVLFGVPYWFWHLNYPIPVLWPLGCVLTTSFVSHLGNLPKPRHQVWILTLTWKLRWPQLHLWWVYCAHYNGIVYFSRSYLCVLV